MVIVVLIGGMPPTENDGKIKCFRLRCLGQHNNDNNIIKNHNKKKKLCKYSYSEMEMSLFTHMHRKMKLLCHLGTSKQSHISQFDEMILRGAGHC